MVPKISGIMMLAVLSGTRAIIVGAVGCGSVVVSITLAISVSWVMMKRVSTVHVVGITL